MENRHLSSAVTANPVRENSDSSNKNHHYPTDHGRFAASKFTGVVRLPNGDWGAEIFTRNRPIWLGTFKSEIEAATSYDSATIKLRNGDPRRNFPLTDITIHELKFQSRFSLVEILNMIKTGSYPMKFNNYLISEVQGISRSPYLQCALGTGLRLLFQKELTPSDVSKLNRLVIPKKYAVEYFPVISEMEGENGSGTCDAELEFFDRSMVLWKFRYCFWKSSQSFVFTRGWNRFAKEKGLRAKDQVIFSTYESGDRGTEARRIIDVAYTGEAMVAPVSRAIVNNGLESESEEMDEDVNEKYYGETSENVGNFSVGAEMRKSVRLFGVEIFG